MISLTIGEPPGIDRQKRNGSSSIIAEAAAECNFFPFGKRTQLRFFLVKQEKMRYSI